MTSSDSKEERRSETGSIRAGHFATALVIALVLYLLSTGPVVRLALDDKIPFRAVEVTYAPLGWMTETRFGQKVLEPFFEWYGVKVWGWNIYFGP